MKIPETIIVVNELAKEHGHTICLPPCHCYYNQTELAWSNLKRKVRKQSKGFKSEAVQRVIYEVSESITVNLRQSNELSTKCQRALLLI